MLAFKLISSIGIFLASSTIGYLYGHRYSARLVNLIYLKQSIKILETEIVYGATPLPDALLNVYRKGKSDISFIFRDISEDLQSNKRYELINSFSTVVTDMETKLNLKKEDIEMFLSLGSVLGTSDRNDQQKNFNLIFNEIDGLIEDAKAEREKNEKLYKTFGVITGIGIVILLV